MRYWSSIALFSFAVAAGCAGQQATPSVPGVATDAARAAIARPAHAHSWMLPEAKAQTLLYSANVYTVTAYTYPGGKLVGTLNNFDNPYGICSDSHGNVYVTDSRFSKIYEYAHGGTKVIRTLRDPLYQPYGCAIDPITGNLAVTNYEDASAREGNVVIYKKARGFPQSYISYGFYYYYWCAYDSSGNLFIDGTYDYGEGFLLAELAKGKHVFQDLNFTKQLSFPGGIAWDGKYLAILDPSTAAIYQFSIGNGLATLENTTDLQGTSYLNGLTIDGSTALVPNQFNSGSNVLFYNYPAGGSPAKTLSKSILDPFSVAISKP
ncbi:MAG TPA: hypothetical protein VGI19_03995 [Candidatus Cybelea sp.]|jgi:hypothetical protein